MGDQGSTHPPAGEGDASLFGAVGLARMALSEERVCFCLRFRICVGLTVLLMPDRRGDGRGWDREPCGAGLRGGLRCGGEIGGCGGL